MQYLTLMQAGLTDWVSAGEAGRRSLDEMFGPLNGVIGSFTGALSELDGLPGLPAGVGAQLQRVMRSVGSAQTQVGTVLATYGKASRVLSGVAERYEAATELTGELGSAVNKVAGMVSPKLASIVSTTLPSPMTPSAAATKPYPHLLVLQPLTPDSAAYYFNLDTAAFEELRRQTEFRWAAQERLTRRPAMQAVGQGEEKISLKGAIYPHFRGGLAQLEALRTIGAKLQPLSLTTGYGDVLGTWCLLRIEEEQSALLQGGIPRKQTFTLEFTRYGNDLQKL